MKDVIAGASFNVLRLLKASGKQKDLCKGSELHAYIRKQKFLDDNCYVHSSLVSMYARCGALAKAQQVFNELPVRDLITWNALIAGYTQQGEAQEALKCFDGMQQEGHSPNAVTFVCVLKACGNIGAASKGEKIHRKILSLGMLEKDLALGNALVDMYIKCASLEKAQQVLNELPARNVVTWTALIAGYAQQGQGGEALKCFDRMLGDGHNPNIVTFICALKACWSIGSAAKGEQIHEKIVSLDMLEKDILLGNILVDMYAKCGALDKAQKVLIELPVQNVVSWNALIAGYIQHGEGEEALNCFDKMQQEGHTPDAISFICALKACGSVGAATKGEEIHEITINSGMLQKNVVLGSIVVDMYGRCGAFAKAEQVLDELLVRDVITWNALITGYAQQGLGEKALTCFDYMQCEGHSPNVITFICVLKACGSIGAATRGEQIHNKVVSLGMLEKEIVLGTALVDMYARCGALVKAQQALNELPCKSVVMWNSLIAAYAQQGQGEEALKYFDSMQQEGNSPNAVTFICALKACGVIGATSKGEQIHDKLNNLGILEKDVELGNTLVDMYARCGALAKAQQVLNELPLRNAVTWNALITGYCQQGQAEEALKCFESMQREGYASDLVTFICALKACGNIGAAVKGEQIHEKITNVGMLKNDIVLKHTLMDMYAKCAVLVKARELLEKLPIQDVVSWNALIGGYAQQGQSVEAMDCFERMQSKGVSPNSSSLVGVLNACSHSGLLYQAEQYFFRMNEYDITPDIEFYCCMVDLFGRAGAFSKALVMITKMPSADYLPLWIALLSACVKWGDKRIGRLAFEHALYLEKHDTAAYVCMANISAGVVQEEHKYSYIYSYENSKLQLMPVW